MADKSAAMFGNYKILEKIDSGGMATVYKGIQLSLDRPVAIKVLLKKLTGDSDMVRRFNRESLIIARLSHPNIIHVIDRGITGKGMPYFVMDFVEGSNLNRIIREGGLSFNEKVDVIIQVAKALSYAHKNGVIHRDIKPANILLDVENHPLVSDFGIAHLFDKSGNGNGGGRGSFTRDGVVMGSPSYMSPEQKLSMRETTEKSDLYSLGAVMYELFTGAKAVGQFRPPTDLDPELPEALEAVILRCLSPDPADRPASADEVKDRLLELLMGAHLGDTQRQRVIQGIPKMEDIFDILDVIRDTAFGSVYLMRHKVRGGLMIAKMYDSRLGGLKEAKMLSALKHPNVVGIHGVSGNEKLYVVVMEYVSAGSLKERLVRPHETAEALGIIRQIVKGLAFAHSHNILHGNLRPSNILIAGDGRVKITDFGLKEHYMEAPDETNWYNVYASPRSPQTDIIAAGCILHEMLTGCPPTFTDIGFMPDDAFEALPVPIKATVAKMINPDRERRYKSMEEVLERVDKVLEEEDEATRTMMAPAPETPPEPEKPPTLRLILLFILLAVTGIGAGWLYASGQINVLMEFIFQLVG